MIRIAQLCLGATLILFGCEDADRCRFGADCASGICTAEGLCAEPFDAGPRDASPRDADVIDAGHDADAGAGDAGRSDAGGGACADSDGRISIDEISLGLGEVMTRRVAENVNVDTHGTDVADGTRQWDLTGPFSGEANRTWMRVEPGGAWYAGRFAEATYVSPLDLDGGLLGVFAVSDAAIRLLGIVSTADGITRTELVYDPPATVWQLPLTQGATWESTVTVSGLLSGVASAYSETWEASVDARGRLLTPGETHEVLRVNTLITRTAGVAITLSRRHAYVEACAGTVADVTAVGAASEPSFATELWRRIP